MKQQDLLYQLMAMDRRGRRIYTNKDLSKVMNISCQKVLHSTLWRQVRQENPLLVRVAHGVYMFALSSKPMTHIVEEIAGALRRGSRNYVSFESALSERGRISQIPVGTLTVATTGNSGRFKTPYGIIEFTQVKHSPLTIMKNTVDCGRPLPLAQEEHAVADLEKVGRNLHLLLPAEQPNLSFDLGGVEP